MVSEATGTSVAELATREQRMLGLRSGVWIGLLAFAFAASCFSAAQAAGKDDVMQHPVFYRTTKVDGLSIFYREAGPTNAPVLLLLHGLPSSSRMFNPLF